MNPLSPLTWAVLAIALWPVSGLLRWRRSLRIALTVWLALALLAMSPLAANALLAPLERSARESPLACRVTPPDVVVVLAGGVDRYPDTTDDVATLGIASRRRMDAAVAYWRRHPQVVLIAAGGAPRFRSPAESNLLVSYAQRQGVPAGALRAETRSATTWANAREVAKLWPQRRRVLLATSAMHMQRARLVFAHFGIETCPLPTDFRKVEVALPVAALPGSSALRKTEAALHEWVGLLVYRTRAIVDGASRTSASASTSSSSTEG